MTMMSYPAVLLFVVVGFVFASEVKGQYFEGYRLYTVLGKTEREVKIITNLIDDYVGVDFWMPPAVNASCFMLLPPDIVNSVEKTLMGNNIYCKHLDVNVEKTIEDGLVKTHRIEDGYLVDHRNYHDEPTILGYLHTLKDSYPQLVSHYHLSNVTHEGRKVVALKVRGLHGPEKKPVIIVEAGVHAREWISPAATLYVIEQLLRNYVAEDAIAKYMLDFFEFHFVPLANPDGYQYSHQSIQNRLWRKNRRRFPGRSCEGVDLNRNFDFYFRTLGTSKNCSSLVYPGRYPFSEPETFNIKKLVESHKQNLVAYISVHSFGQFLFTPYSVLPRVHFAPKNIKELLRLSREMESTMSMHGVKYQAGEIYYFLKYLASGTVCDWILHVKEGIFATTLELRPSFNDTRAFNLPPNEIVATGHEMLKGLETLVNFMNSTIVEALMGGGGGVKSKE